MRENFSVCSETVCAWTGLWRKNGAIRRLSELWTIWGPLNAVPHDLLSPPLVQDASCKSTTLCFPNGSAPKYHCTGERHHVRSSLPLVLPPVHAITASLSWTHGVLRSIRSEKEEEDEEEEGNPAAVKAPGHRNTSLQMRHSSDEWRPGDRLAPPAITAREEEERKGTPAATAHAPFLHVGHRARAGVRWLIAVPRQHLVRAPVHSSAWLSDDGRAHRPYIKIVGAVYATSPAPFLNL